MFILLQVRKTSIRMTSIKEYPFDLSDLQNQTITASNNNQPPQAQTEPSKPLPSLTVPASNADGKRKVSIMADESSKDRENLPSEK